MSVIEGEETEILVEGSRVEALFDETAFKIRDSVAIKFGNTALTYQQLKDRSDSIANKLQHLTSKQPTNQSGDLIIAVCFEPSPELICTLLAIWKIGGAYVPIDPTFPEGHVIHILEDSRPAFIVTDGGTHSYLKSAAKKAGIPLIAMNDVKSAEAALPQTNAQDVAIVLYTSGSTGTPKGVRLTHKNIYCRLAWQWREFPFEENEACCFKTALTFVDSVAEIFGPLIKGVPVTIVLKKDVQNPENLIDILEKNRISRFILVPSLLRNILAALGKKNRKLQLIKMWVCSGEPLGEDLVLTFFRHFPQGTMLANFYGSTEVMGDVTYDVIRSQNDAKNVIFEQKVPIGKVVHNCRVYLMDVRLNPVPLGEIGEIYVAGAHVASGYIGGKGSDRFVKNPFEPTGAYPTLYRTGDFARIVNGKLIYEGRKDGQVKVRGHRVDMSQIENAIVVLGEMKESIVLCYKPGEVFQDIVAFCSPINGISQEATLDGLRSMLPAYMLPKVIFIDTFPRLVNGKLDRQSLLRHFEELSKRNLEDFQFNLNGFTADGNEIAAATALVKTVASTINGWSCRDIDFEWNFFDVGGNSLNAILVVTKLQGQGFDINISDFLCAKTLREVLEHMTKNEASDPVCKCAKVKTPEPISSKYTLEKMKSQDKYNVIDLMSACFSTKGDLELLSGATYDDFEKLLSEMYSKVIKKELSFIVKSSDDVIVGASFNTDLYDPVPIKPPNRRVSDVFDLIDLVEAPVRDALEMKGIKGCYLHGQMMGTKLDLTAAENVAVVQIMEQEVLRMAKECGFMGVLTTNTSNLTQQMCGDVLGYKTLADFAIRHYTAADGSKPFENAGDSQRIQTTLKLF